MFSDTKIRCSSIGAIMTNAKSKSEILGETCKQKLVDIYIEKSYQRRKDLLSKFISKGLEEEDSSITLLSRINKKMYVKNEEEFSNSFLTGTPDIIDGDIIRDTKTSWDIFTFFKMCPITTKVDKDYYWQMQGYMALTGAKCAYVDYCLVDTPEALIDKEKFYFQKDLGIEPDESILRQGWELIEKNHTYDDIPIEERLISFKVERDKAAIKSIYDRVEICREWMTEHFANKSEFLEACHA